MNKKIFQPILMAALSPLIICPTVISCKQKEPEPEPEVVIDAIDVNCNVKSLMPGDTAYAWCIAQPFGTRFMDIDWSIIESPSSEITIDENGYISIPSTTEIEEIGKLVIQASCRHYDLKNTLQLYVVPLSSSKFIGFEDNEIQYFDRELGVQRSKINKNGNEYRTPYSIDVFRTIGEFVKPDGFVSKVKFNPIEAGEYAGLMLFSIRENALYRHGISWVDYENDDITETIPDFRVVDPTVMSEIIDVHFLSDPTVKFSIYLSLWHDPDESSQGYMTYSSTPSDPQKLDVLSTAVYSSKMYAPIEPNAYSGQMHSILCTRPKYEYADLEFDVGISDALPAEIKACIKYDFSYDFVVRPFDHHRFYRMNVDYTFDSSLLTKSPKEWGYQEFEALRIVVRDRVTHYVLTTLSFYISWE